MIEKKRLLFVSRRIPGPFNGSSLRAWNVLKALHSCYEIDLLIVPPSHPFSHPVPKKITTISSQLFDFSHHRQGLFRKIHWRFLLYLSIMSNRVWSTSSLCFFPISKTIIKQIFSIIIPREYDVIHLFKLEVASLLPKLKEQFPSAKFHLDLDDFESMTWKRTKEIHRLNGNKVKARLASLREEVYRKLEQNILPAFERVYVCSGLDKKKIEQAYQLNNIQCLPNIYPFREIAAENATKKVEEKPGPFCYVWVSFWGYYPNLDSLLYFCGDILPLLRKLYSKTFKIQVIGQGRIPRNILQKLQEQKELVYRGEVDKVDRYYEGADAALVPLRAGGGTRLKVLEAFAFGVPVISTSIGVEGLEVEHGKHALVADSPSEFAAQCVRLSEDANLRRTLVQHASTLLKEKYSPARLREILCNPETEFAHRRLANSSSAYSS